MLLRSARMTACATCELPLVLEIESDGDDKMDSTSRGGASTTVAHTVPDDVQMSCGCHFHWYLYPYQTSPPLQASDMYPFPPFTPFTPPRPHSHPYMKPQAHPTPQAMPPRCLPNPPMPRLRLKHQLHLPHRYRANPLHIAQRRRPPNQPRHPPPPHRRSVPESLPRGAARACVSGILQGRGCGSYHRVAKKPRRWL